MVGDAGRRLLVCRNDLWFQPDLVDLGESIFFIANVIPQMLIKLFNPLQFCKPEACTDLPAKVTWGIRALLLKALGNNTSFPIPVC